MTTPQFGKLIQVDVRELWKREYTDFTEWLSHKENLDLLAAELQIQLDFVQKNRQVGDFFIDIVAKIPNPDAESEEFVVIENQLEDSNHDHLGKLITYAAGIDAKKVILICKNLRDEHKTAINWLNKISSGVNFFAVRIEAWKIDESLPAPKFNVICMPNDWEKYVKQSVSSDKDLTETKKMQLEFWTSFSIFLKVHNSSLRPTKVYPQHWCDISIGTSKGHLSLVVDTRQNLVSAAFYASNDEDKKIFNQLLSKRQEIESEMGSELIWMELPDKKASRIKIEKKLERLDRDSWNIAYQFLKEHGEKIQKIFPKYL
jgi:hypothetical protein